MDSTETAALRDLSRSAFGQTYRLEVMLAVRSSQDGLVCLTDLAKELGLPVSNVQGALKCLVALDLVTEMPSGDSRRKFYLRNPSAAWTWAEEMAKRAGYELVTRLR